ncbi:MAG: T9SS type A sorting domain-containing protein [Bacteroidota bacterium]|nr:T9SS type A sorting domain-containing protein [Bacteroidota bacterium]
MKKYLYFIVFCFCLPKNFYCQLLPTIGLNSQPINSATICNEPFYLGSYYTSGLSVGDTVPDFKLYAINGDSLILSNELSAGKPILLISGSLTCPVFRNKVNTINQVISTYGSAIKVFVIYTIEAHPTDTSVYFGYINVTNQNTSAGILFPQPTTYGARKQMVDTMSSFVSLNAPVFVDGPCNQWWKTFGPAPNNAYLIKPNGVVAKKHGWFDKAPDKIFCDIDNVLAITSGSCTTTTAPGNFSINVINSFVSGNPEDLLYDFVKIVNTQSVNVTIKTKKIQKNHPVGWQTAFCADVCYSASEDSVEFTILPNDSLLFSLDFYTDAIPDSGSVKVGFRNINNTNNSYSVRLRASTLPIQIGINENTKYIPNFSLYPNPSKDQTAVVTDETEYSFTIQDYMGKEVYFAINNPIITTSQFKNGVYFISLKTKNGTYSRKLVVQN